MCRIQRKGKKNNKRFIKNSFKLVPTEQGNDFFFIVIIPVLGTYMKLPYLKYLLLFNSSQFRFCNKMVLITFVLYNKGKYIYFLFSIFSQNKVPNIEKYLYNMRHFIYFLLDIKCSRLKTMHAFD